MTDKIIELDSHEPSVDSVISKLGRYKDKVKSITAIIEWDDGSYSVNHDTREVSSLCYDSVVLQKYMLTFVEDKEEY